MSRDGRHRDRTCSHSTVHAYHTSILRIAQNQQPRGSHLSHKCLFSYNDIKYSSVNFNILSVNLLLTYFIYPYLVSQYVISTIFSFVNFRSRLFFLVALRPSEGHALLIHGFFLDHTQRRTTVGRTPLDE